MSKALREEKDVVKQLQAKPGERDHEPAAEPAGSAEPLIVEEICVEELAIDGICGVY